MLCVFIFYSNVLHRVEIFDFDEIHLSNFSFVKLCFEVSV